jgi:hypothetical protein
MHEWELELHDAFPVVVFRQLQEDYPVEVPEVPAGQIVQV